MSGAGKRTVLRSSGVHALQCVVLTSVFWWCAAAPPPPVDPEPASDSAPQAQVLDWPVIIEAGVEAPPANMAKTADAGSAEVGASAPGVVVPPLALPAARAAAPPVAPVCLLEPTVRASRPDAGGQDTRQRKKRRVVVDFAVVSLPSFFPKGSELGPDVREGAKASVDGASEEMKLFCSSIQRLGLSMEPGFTVNIPAPAHLLCDIPNMVAVAPGTKCGFGLEPGLGLI